MIPGPIGSILAPINQINKKKDLPFASSLCGSCSDVCPVKIDIHDQLYKWRQIISKEVTQSFVKKTAMKIMGNIWPVRFDVPESDARVLDRRIGR